MVGAAGLQEAALRLSDLPPRGTISRSGGIRIAQGAIYNSGGTLELINCQLTDNTANYVSDCCACARRIFVFLVSVNCAHSLCHRARGSSPADVRVGTDTHLSSARDACWHVARVDVVPFFRVAPTTIPRLIHHRFPWDGSMDVDAWGHGSF